MTTAEHPLDVILRDFPGITRVTEESRKATPTDTPLPAVATFLAIVLSDSQVAKPECTRCLIRFADNGIVLTTPWDTEIWGMPRGQVLPDYFVGLGLCHCSPQKGGARINPMCYALNDKGQPLELAERVLTRWIATVRAQPELFCVAGVETLHQLHVI